MSSEPRKATDILLEMEAKLDIALSIMRTQDLNIKILSNKVNALQAALDKRPAEAPKIVVEAVQTQKIFPTQVQAPDNHVMVTPDDKLPLESEPLGFRRTSRPETFAGDDAYLAKSSSAVTPRYPVQTPNIPPPGRGPTDASPGTPPPGREATAVVAPPAPKKVEAPKPAEQPKQAPVLLQNAVPVQQRVVNAHGKSLFLADVEIIDLSTMQPVTKTRTNATGKWMASLGIGQYRVIIRKLEAATKAKMEFSQDIEIDGSQSPLELQAVIIKA